MPVLYKGFTIGHVKEITLTEDDRVEVVFTIFNEYSHRVTEGSLVEVQNSPIPGFGNSFQFYPGAGTELIPDGSVIPEVRSLQARILISAGLTRIPSNNDGIGYILNQVTEILETVNISLAGYDGAEDLALGQIMGNLERTTAGIATLSATLSGQLSPLIHNIESITGRISDPSGTVMGILDGDGNIYSSIEASIASIASIIDNLDRTTEFIPSQLPQVGVLVNELNVMIRSLQDVLVAVANNPLLRGGIPERVETTPGGASPRNLEF
jgi:phospholipid/cholesterol/gamma-HCH transport system substrate-binding protein